LDRVDGFDPGAAATFERGAYRTPPATHAAILRPFGGTGRGPIAPSAGALQSPATPARGAIAVYSGVVLEPPAGHHLEKPSALTVFQDSKRVERNMAMDARSHDPSPEVETGFAK